jgi:hypothetical protein
MSLYPYICKYFKFPVGHPVIHVGDACKDKEAVYRRMVLRNFRLYRLRDSTILSFLTEATSSLCISCVHERNI